MDGGQFNRRNADIPVELENGEVMVIRHTLKPFCRGNRQPELSGSAFGGDLECADSGHINNRSLLDAITRVFLKGVSHLRQATGARRA